MSFSARVFFARKRPDPHAEARIQSGQVRASVPPRARTDQKHLVHAGTLQNLPSRPARASSGCNRNSPRSSALNVSTAAEIDMKRAALIIVLAGLLAAT